MIKVFEAFAGIGTQRMALRNLGIEHEVVAIAEIDKFAIASYEAIHGEVNNLGDISKIKTEDIPDHDLFTYSFPCQDISIAGKQAGLKEGAGTRSGLLWECEKVIEGKRPKYLLMENVKNLVGKKFKADFDKWLERLEELGYSNYWQVLNAKDYGIPQNRERVFCISILGEHTPYEFPKGFQLDLKLKDILEDEVEEKFYLSQKQVDRITFSNYNQNKRRIHEKDYSDTLYARDYKDPKCVRIGGIFDKDGKRHQAGSIWDKEQLSPTLDTMQGGWRQPSVVIGSSRGRNPENPSDRTVGVKTEQRLEIDKNGTSNTLTSVQKDNLVVEPYRIRKLIPLECWRLMGCTDEDFEKAAYELREIIFKGGNESWNVKLVDVTENQTHENMETFALNIIKDLKGQEEILTEWIKSLKMPENEKEQNVNVVIEKLGELEHSDSATSIIKCTDYMEILTILMEEKDPLHKVIIELDPKVSTSTAKYMKITSEESLNPLKLSIILTLIEQITESKIFISTLRKVNICGHISVTENLLSDTENQIELSLKTEAMFTRISASQLYKQAGNAIVVDVLEAIFNKLFIDTESTGNNGNTFFREEQ